MKRKKTERKYCHFFRSSGIFKLKALPIAYAENDTQLVVILCGLCGANVSLLLIYLRLYLPDLMAILEEILHTMTSLSFPLTNPYSILSSVLQTNPTYFDYY